MADATHLQPKYLPEFISVTHHSHETMARAYRSYYLEIVECQNDVRLAEEAIAKSAPPAPRGTKPGTPGYTTQSPSGSGAGLARSGAIDQLETRIVYLRKRIANLTENCEAILADLNRYAPENVFGKKTPGTP